MIQHNEAVAHRQRSERLPVSRAVALSHISALDSQPLTEWAPTVLTGLPWWAGSVRLSAPP